MEYTVLKFCIAFFMAWVSYFNFSPSILLSLVVFYASWHATRCYINFAKGRN